MKMYPQMTREYIRDDISFVNLIALQQVIPPYRKPDDKPEHIHKQKGGSPIDELERFHDFLGDVS